MKIFFYHHFDFCRGSVVFVDLKCQLALACFYCLTNISVFFDNNIPICYQFKVLNERISRLSKALEGSGWKVSSSTNNFYKLPIADCVFGSENLFVTIKIPVIKTQNDYKIIRLTSVPFHHRNSQCSISNLPKLAAVNGRMAIPISGEDSEHCKLSSHSLCKIPQGPIDSTGCLTGVLVGGTQENLSKVTKNITPYEFHLSHGCNIYIFLIWTDLQFYL